LPQCVFWSCFWAPCLCKCNRCDHLYSWSLGTILLLRCVSWPRPCSAFYLQLLLLPSSSMVGTVPPLGPCSALCSHAFGFVIWTFDFCGCDICFQSLPPIHELRECPITNWVLYGVFEIRERKHNQLASFFCTYIYLPSLNYFPRIYCLQILLWFYIFSF
jgi:hypothetical protein